MGLGLTAATCTCLISVFSLCIAAGQAQTSASESRPFEVASCRSSSASNSASGSAIKETAQRFIAERLGVWRERLKLNEWSISPALTSREELKLRTLGGIRWDKAKKSAVVWILDPAYYQLPICEMLDDIEMTIVHELIHLKLASLPRSEASRSSEEHAVNGIAEALLFLDRAKQ